MSNTSTTASVLPTEALETRLRAVSSMLRDCLLASNKKLKELDFAHLQMYTPVLSEDENTVGGKVLVKASSGNRYKLESNQVFQYTRIDADVGLADLGFTGRVFDKSQYNEVANLLEPIGTLTITKGNIADSRGDAVISFVFGTRHREVIPANYIDLSSDVQVKAHYAVAFKGKVDLVFKGETIEEPNVDPKQDESYINVASFFLNRNLGNII